MVEFKENKRKLNLEDGFLYQKLLTKLPEVMLMKWNKKMCKDDVDLECVESLRDWCQREVSIRKKTYEI